MEKTRNDYMTHAGHKPLCAQCGYRFALGDDGFRVKQTGDIIHRDCFMDYMDDNVNELCDELEF